MKQASHDAALLHGMSDRELNDIGINRSDINRVCQEHVQRTINENLKGHV